MKVDEDGTVRLVRRVSQEDRNRVVLGLLIAWMGDSLGADAQGVLLGMLHGRDDDGVRERWTFE